MKLSHMKKNKGGYFAAIILLSAAVVYSFFIFNAVNDSSSNIKAFRSSLQILTDLEAGIKSLELCLCKNKETFTLNLCDTLYTDLTEKGVKLKELVKGNSPVFEKCNQLLIIFNDERKTQIHTDSSLSDKINKRELKEYIERDKISRIKKIITEIKSIETSLLDSTEQHYLAKSKLFIYSLVASVFLLFVTIAYSLFIIFSESKEKDKFRKNQEAYFNIAKAAEETRTPEKLYKTIHDIIIQLTGAESFYAANYNPQEDLISFPYFVNSTASKPEDRIAGRGLAEFIVRTNMPLLASYDDMTKLIEEGEIINEGAPVISVIASPIEYGSNVFGVLAAQSYQEKFKFTENDLAVLNFAAKVTAELIVKLKMEEQNNLAVDEMEIEKSVIEGNLAEIKELTKKLEEAEQQVEKLNANKNKYFSILSHDLKSPFNSLIGFSDILVEDFDDLSKEEIKKYADIISVSTHNLYNLIDNIVQWSKLQRNTIEFVPAIINLRSEVIYVFDLLSINAAKKNITLVNKVNPDIKLLADKSMLHSTLQNLILNAIKYTNKDGRVVVEASDKKLFTEIIIADTGVGIKKENIEKLFRVEKSFSTKGTENEQGTGLGLIIVKEMVEKHGGKIKVSSVEGKGTAFFIEYPKVI